MTDPYVSVVERDLLMYLWSTTDSTPLFWLYIYFINHEFEIRTTSQPIQQIKPYNSPAIRTRLHEETLVTATFRPRDQAFSS